MADYRLDCCGGFPSCVCAKKRADAERAAAARKRAEATDSTWRGEAPDHSYAVKFECNKCAAVTNEPECVSNSKRRGKRFGEEKQDPTN